MSSSLQVARDAKAVLDTELDHAKRETAAMQKTIADLMEEGAAAKRQTEAKRAKQDQAQAKLEEQISMLEKTLEIEASKLVTSEQELSSSTRHEVELKKQISMLEDELKTRTSRLEAELASSQQV